MRSLASLTARGLAALLLPTLLLLLAATVRAQGDIGILSGPGVPPPAIESAAADFLPVDAAYPLHVAIEPDELLVAWDITPGYYLYRERVQLGVRDGDALERIRLKLPSGEPHDDPLLGMTEVFRGRLELRLKPPRARRFVLEVRSQGCADAGLCYPPRTRRFDIDPAQGVVTELEVPRAAAAAAAAEVIAPPAPRAAGAGETLYMALLAVLGGLILNLMPCVFPVLSLKALSMAAHVDGRRSLHGLLYTAGVVLSFVLVAAALIGLRGAGEAIGWGFHLQSPLFVAALVYLFVAMGLALAGVVNLGAGLMGAGSSLARRTGYAGSFFTGVLATVVASPCTAPFMGTALGFALAQSTAVGLAVFAALGFGMALPFLLLALSPALARYLPRPGPWMETFKQFLAFPLLVAAVWLLWVLGNQTGVNAMAAVALGCVGLGLALWLWERAARDGRRWPLRALAIVLLAGVIAILDSPLLATRQPANAVAGAEWEPYSTARFEELRAAGKPVFINVTADWCLTCLANERVALASDAVLAAFRERGITYLKGDWTNSDPVLTELLRQHGRSGVPLYLYYGPGDRSSATILPQLLTPGGVIEAISR